MLNMLQKKPKENKVKVNMMRVLKQDRLDTLKAELTTQELLPQILQALINVD